MEGDTEVRDRGQLLVLSQVHGVSPDVLGELVSDLRLVADHFLLCLLIFRCHEFVIMIILILLIIILNTDAQ